MLLLLATNHLTSDETLKEAIYTPVAGEVVSSLKLVYYDRADVTLSDTAADAAWAELGNARPAVPQFAAGEHTTTSGEASANTISIATGLGSITAAIVQVVDAGNNVVTTDADITFSAGNLIVADGSTYNTVAGQKLRWIAYKA